MSEETKTNLKSEDNNNNNNEKLGTPVSKWTVEDVSDWIKDKTWNIGLGYILKNNWINGELLLRLDDGDLESMGLVKKIERTKILFLRDKLATSEDIGDNSNVTKMLREHTVSNKVDDHNYSGYEWPGVYNKIMGNGLK